MLKLIRSLIAVFVLLLGITMPVKVMAIELGQVLPFEKVQTLDGTYFEIPKNNTKNTLIKYGHPGVHFARDKIII